MSYKVLLSLGLGRIHLVSAAKALSEEDVRVTLVCGAAWGRSRRIPPDTCAAVRTLPLVDVLDWLRRRVLQFLHLPFWWGESACWSLFGFCSRKYMKGDCQIFHVRAGAGQGGAIAKAQRLGMKVIVDMSALEPHATEGNLAADCKRWGVPLPIAPDRGVWKNVMRDCQMADVILANSNQVKQSLVGCGFDAAKIRVVYLGVREDFFGVNKVILNNRFYTDVDDAGKEFTAGAIAHAESCDLLDLSSTRATEEGVISFSAFGSLARRQMRTGRGLLSVPRNIERCEPRPIPKCCAMRRRSFASKGRLRSNGEAACKGPRIPAGDDILNRSQFCVRGSACGITHLQHQFRILFTGKFCIMKGAEYFIRAMEILRDRGVDVAADIVGVVELPRELKDRCQSLPIVFHGPKSQDALRAYMETSDVYVFPSLSDGCAQSGMEALAVGLCVITTRESGLPIVDRESGYVALSKDANAIANRIEWLLSHREEVVRTGVAAAKLIQKDYTWRKYAENTVKVYAEVSGG